MMAGVPWEAIGISLMAVSTLVAAISVVVRQVVGATLLKFERDLLEKLERMYVPRELSELRFHEVTSRLDRLPCGVCPVEKAS